MRSIGELARASGLSVSALRFYDGAGVLVPALVDPATGYRWYADDQVRTARLVAGLRRVGMPLPDIGRALGLLSDPAAVRLLLDAHLRRLEDGLADARRELSRVHALLDSEEKPMTRITLSPADLSAALDAVRFAAGHDPALPMLAGVLIEADAGGVRLVATDRYRLAVAATPAAEISGPPIRLIAPTALIDEVRTQPAPAGPITLTLEPSEISFDGFGRRIAGAPVDADFPDYRRLLSGEGGGGEPAARRVTVDVEALRSELACGIAPVITREHLGVRHDLAVLSVDPAGTLRFAADDAWAGAESEHVAVNRSYLLEALDAGGGGQLVLELDGPIKPLAIRAPGTADSFSILMPVRL